MAPQSSRELVHPWYLVLAQFIFLGDTWVDWLTVSTFGDLRLTIRNGFDWLGQNISGWESRDQDPHASHCFQLAIHRPHSLHSPTSLLTQFFSPSIKFNGSEAFNLFFFLFAGQETKKILIYDQAKQWSIERREEKGPEASKTFGELGYLNVREIEFNGVGLGKLTSPLRLVKSRAISSPCSNRSETGSKIYG